MGDERRTGVSLAVFGSRNLAGPKIKSIIAEQLDIIKPKYIVVPMGENAKYFMQPSGVTLEAKNLAIEKNIIMKLVAINKKDAAGGIDKRNRRVIEEAELFLFVHDGISKGTKNELELVKKSKKPFIYKLVTQSIGIDVGMDNVFI